MRKIEEKEFNELIIKSGRGERHPIIEELLKLEVGEAVFVSREEWTKRTPLNVYVGNYKIRMGIALTIRKINKEGWAIKRLK